MENTLRNTNFDSEVQFDSMKDALWRLTTRVYLLEDFISEKFGEVIGPSGFSKVRPAKSNIEVLPRTIPLQTSKRKRVSKGEACRKTKNPSRPTSDTDDTTSKKNDRKSTNPENVSVDTTRQDENVKEKTERRLIETDEVEDPDLVLSDEEVIEKLPAVGWRKGKRKRLSMEEKFEISKRLKKGETRNLLCREFSISPATLTLIKQNSAKIASFFSDPVERSKDRKAFRDPENRDVEKAVFQWFAQKRSVGEPISGPLLREKALYFNKKMKGGHSFKASSGWLFKFQKRHGIKQISTWGKKPIENQAEYENFMQEFNQTVSDGGYTRDTVYNCDESGLNWKALPSKSLASRTNENSSEKEKLTLLFCANASGTNRLPLVVIGKTEKRNCLEESDKDLPIWYKCHKNGLMDGDIFAKWFFHEFVPSVRRFNRDNNLPEKALLLLDSAPVHPWEEMLQTEDGQFKVQFLPANIASFIQPMEQGVIDNFKSLYREALLKRLLTVENRNSDTVVQFWKKFSVRDSITLAAASWTALKRNTVQRSWRKFWPDSGSLEKESLVTDNCVVLASNLSGFSDCDRDDIEKWIKEDSQELGYTILTDDQIVDSVINSKSEENSKIDDDSEYEESEEQDSDESETE